MRSGRLNAAPFSAYNYLCTDPPIMGIGVTNRSRERLCTQGHGPQHPAHRRVCGERGHRRHRPQQMNICATEFPEELNEFELAALPPRRLKRSRCRASPRPTPRSSAGNTRRWRSAGRGSSWGAWWPCTSKTGTSIPTGPTSRPKSLHSIGRMNGLGNYVRTRDAFMTIPRISYEEWKKGQR